MSTMQVGSEISIEQALEYLCAGSHVRATYDTRDMGFNSQYGQTFTSFHPRQMHTDLSTPGQLALLQRKVVPNLGEISTYEIANLRLFAIAKESHQ